MTMQFKLDESIAVLKRTPRVLDVMLRGLPEDWIQKNDGPETWSPFDVVGHLIHGEKTDWIPRVEIILNEPQRPFTPFDRFAQFKASEGKSLNQLLDEFATLRAQNVSKLKKLHLQPAAYEKTGIHPEFGVVTLRNLLSTWVAHDLGHIMQVSRTMARQYKEETGPWPAYLSVLQDGKTG